MSTSSYEHHDVLIIGAGISGVSAAVHLQKQLPGKDYLILEKRQAIGGTWDLFRYPGIRSDSDMFTLGFDFKPWEDEHAIGDGTTIREYVTQAARENGVEQRIRYGHRVVAAAWDSVTARWTLTAEVADGEHVKLTADFVHFASGYYSYETPNMPEYPGAERFEGRLIHPQHWPEDLDYSGKRIVVIGSGATAISLVPALTDKAAHVTMLQRSPSYILSVPHIDPIANGLRKVLPKHVAYQLTRAGRVAITYGTWVFFRGQPERAAKVLRNLQQRQLPEDFPIDVHFKPRYKVWDERLCFVPDGDLFKALSEGSADIVTDRIETLTPTGIRLESGQELEADIIVSATGFNLQLLGGAEVSVDGEPVDLSKLVTYKGVMFSGLPNLAATIGYINASWTLKADLVARYVGRLLKYMDKHGYDEVLPLAPPDGQQRQNFFDPLVSGYVKRSAHLVPKQGTEEPWRAHQNWFRDVQSLLRAPLADRGVRFFTRRAADAGSVAPVAETV